MITLTCNSSLPKNENMSLKNKTNKTTKEKEKIDSSGGSRSPDLWRPKATHYLLRYGVRLNINIFNIFCP